MIRVVPEQSMFDEDLDVSVHDLQPGKMYVLRLLPKAIEIRGTEPTDYGNHAPILRRKNRISDVSGEYESWAKYRANRNGVISCAKDVSLDGTFTGIDGMGLFWSLDACPGQKPGMRFMKKDVTTPLQYKITIENADTHATLHSLFVYKHFLHPAYKRVEVMAGKLRGALFVPKDSSIRCPGVIDIFGTGGGSIEHRASLLASKGFTVFALAYFRYQDLPTNLDDGVELAYFLDAVEWFSKHPQVDFQNGIGFIGVSLGADIAYAVGSLTTQVIASVGINGYYGNNDVIVPLKLHGKPFNTSPMAFGDLDVLAPTPGTPFAFHIYLRTTNQTWDNIYPIEDSLEPIKFLAIVGEKDTNGPSFMSNLALERLTRFGKGHLMDVIMYPGAGHLLEPPWQPFKAVSYHKILDSLILWGGDPSPHAEAQKLSWLKIIQFLSKEIGQPVRFPLPEFPLQQPSVPVNKSKL